MYIDSHGHLFMSHYDKDRDAVLARARAAGVAANIEVGIDLDSGRRVLELGARHEGVFPALGFHPHYADKFDEPGFWALWEQGAGSCVALGEIGLDYYRDLSSRESQRRVFERLAGRGLELGVPLIIHVRDAMDDALAVLRALSDRWAGVMHCFSGGVEDMQTVLGLGFCISVAGPVTYPRSDGLRQVAEACPRDRLLIETDAPFLTPRSRRGKRNEPAYLVQVAEQVGALWGVGTEEAGRITARNARVLFGLE